MQDGVESVFTQFYFCLSVVIGHYYLMQLFLAVVLANLSRIMSHDAYDQMREKKQVIKQDQEAERKESTDETLE